MGLGDIGASSFEFYEGIRIILPGAFAVALYAAIIATFGLHGPAPQNNALGAFVGALGIGLVLYLVDAPARSAYYRESLPHAVFRDWNLRRNNGVSDLNYYYVMLDQDVPAGIRARALYMGSIYRIGWESLYLMVAASVAVFTVGALGVGTRHDASRDALYAVFSALGLAYVALGVIAVSSDRKRMRERRRDGAPTSIVEELKQQYGCMTLALTLIGAAAVCVAAITSRTMTHVLLPVGIGSLAVIGGARYMRGYGERNARRAIWTLPALLMLATVSLASCACLAFDGPRFSVLSPGALTGWAALDITAAVLVVARGHERRLGGGYATQRSWFLLNRDRLEAKYGEPQADERDHVATQSFLQRLRRHLH